MLGNLRLRARLRCRRPLTTLHFSGIVGFSPHTYTRIQQGFIDERAPLNPTTVDPARTADEGEDEDEQDDEMSEPTQLTRTEKRKDIDTDETTKELRAPLTLAHSSHASSLRPCDETQEQLERSSKQARTARKGVERYEMSHICSKRVHCEHQRNEFLQVRDGWVFEKATRRKC